jgi:hypothetical protein
MKSIINDLEIPDETKSALVSAIVATFATLIQRHTKIVDDIKSVLEENAKALAKIKSLVGDMDLELKLIQFDADMTKKENQELREKLEQL